MNLCPFLLLACSIPLSKLNPHYQKKINKILQNPSFTSQIQKKLRTTQFIYEYLLNRLPLTAKLLHTLQNSPYQIKKINKNLYAITDQKGAQALVKLIYLNHNQRLYFAYGQLKLPPLPPIYAQGFVHICYQTKDKQTLLAKAKFSIRFENLLLHNLSKTLSQLLKGFIQKKIYQVVQHSQKISEYIHQNPKKIYQQMKKSNAFTPQQRREFKMLFLP